MTAQLMDCAYLHSAFGPGCPYCWRPAAPAGQDDRAWHGPRAPGAGEPGLAAGSLAEPGGANRQAA
jgi:hypothetical protein